MAKIIQFPLRMKLSPPEPGISDVQRRWLLANPEVNVAIKWDWPRQTWFSRRLQKVREEKRMTA